MKIEKNMVFHMYNRGNNRDKIFYNRDNYIFFLRKVRKQLYPVCDILAYCLMPNHFHFLIYANEKTIEDILVAGIQKNIFSEKLRILLSSYTQAINKQEGRTGSLFQQNTKFKPMNDIYRGIISKTQKNTYIIYCFFYVHQNPLKAKLVNRMEDWEFSSFWDYANIRNGTLINKELAYEIINFDKDNFVGQSNSIINDDFIDFIEK